ncbi:hypothetical protein J7E81_27890 [Bacillus sp. ISL-18]|nr:hypothetical protein [Bacillus sp. ISL-18]MBT2658997.1 hypothetical protein [Bacillus sp. ISL-18]
MHLVGMMISKKRAMTDSGVICSFTIRIVTRERRRKRLNLENPRKA